MLEIIYRERNKKDRNEWIRHLVNVKTGDIESVDFLNPISDERVYLTPLETNLYLLDYLKISFPSNSTKLTIKMVLDRIPKDIIENVSAVEFQMIFEDPWFASLFSKDVKDDNIVAFVALLTKKDTGKRLPTTRLTNDRPIGISDDDWRRVVSEFYLK